MSLDIEKAVRTLTVVQIQNRNIVWTWSRHGEINEKCHMIIDIILTKHEVWRKKGVRKSKKVLMMKKLYAQEGVDDLNDFLLVRWRRCLRPPVWPSYGREMYKEQSRFGRKFRSREIWVWEAGEITPYDGFDQWHLMMRTKRSPLLRIWKWKKTRRCCPITVI